MILYEFIGELRFKLYLFHYLLAKPVSIQIRFV